LGRCLWQPLAVVQFREGCAQWASPRDDQRLEQLIAKGVVIADGNQVFFALMARVVEDRDIMGYIGPALRADQLLQSSLHRTVQRRQRDLFMVEEPIGASGEGFLRPVGGTEHAKAISRLTLEQRLKQQGGARTQAFVGQRGVLEQCFEVYHTHVAEEGESAALFRLDDYDLYTGLAVRLFFHMSLQTYFSAEVRSGPNQSKNPCVHRDDG